MKLSKKVLIPKEVLKDKQYNAISDYLSDKFGFCVNSFELKGNYAIKINWDITI
jgi:hypothetical protein